MSALRSIAFNFDSPIRAVLYSLHPRDWRKNTLGARQHLQRVYTC